MNDHKMGKSDHLERVEEKQILKSKRSSFFLPTGNNSEAP